MSSPMFSYPQPTDDELAAQQPAYPTSPPPAFTGDSSPLPEASPAPAASPHPDAPPADRPTDGSLAASGLGRTALVLAIIAAALSVLASAVFGATIGPREAEFGTSFFEAPDWYSTLAIALVCVQGLCTLLGLTSLIIAVIAMISHRGRVPAMIAIAIIAGTRPRWLIMAM
ncbi:hypothetical protein DFO66_11675, partial [Brevibacterium sanguinis]